MSTDDKKPNPEAASPLHVDLLPEPEGLSEDPFSEDFESTVIASAPQVEEFDADDTGEETTEVTQKISIDPPVLEKPKTPLAGHVPIAKPSQKTTPAPTSLWAKLALAASVTLGVVVLVVVIFTVSRYWHPEEIKPTQQSVQIDIPENLFPPQDHDIQVSPLSLTSESLKNKSIPEVFLGEELEWEFALTHWQTLPGQNLNFYLEIKIFGPSGLLVYHNPNLKTFSGLADASQEEIQSKLNLRVLSKMELGIYRFRLDVVDKSSNRRKTLQTRFRVLSRVH